MQKLQNTRWKEKAKGKMLLYRKKSATQNGPTAVMKYSRSKCPEVQKITISSITF